MFKNNRGSCIKVMELSQDLRSLFLSEILTTYFKLVSHRKEAEVLHLSFEELNIKPEPYSSEQLYSGMSSFVGINY